MFIVYSLPRSRTYWLSRFLTYGDWYCSHDELVHCRTMDDVNSFLAMPNTGTVETLASPYWRLVKDIKTVIVRRPVAQVVASIAALGLDVDYNVIKRLDRKLDQIEQRIPSALSVDFADLASEATCRAIFEFCLPYEHDHDWWKLTSGMNLQINFPHMLRYYAAHANQLIKLSKIAKHHCLQAIKHDDIIFDDRNGVTIQQEPFASAYADGQKMYADHCVLVGEAPDSHQHKNLELMQALEDDGNLIVTTARSNGRLFGYLVATLSPSLESPDTKCAIHTMFFTEVIKGLGMRLQRASIEALRQRGVHEVYFHAGVRGSGPRMGTIFKRLGAQPFGDVWKLDLRVNS